MAGRTIVRKLRGGNDTASHRYVILSEVGISPLSYRFMPVGGELSLRETFIELAAIGISTEGAITLLNEADASFDKP